MAKSNINVNVTALHKKNSADENKVLYSGTFVDGVFLSEYESQLSRELADHGYFKDLSHVAEAIEVGIRDIVSHIQPDKRSDLGINFTSDIHYPTYYDGVAYIDLSGKYLHKPLDETELESLIDAVDQRVRSFMYENSSSSTQS